MTITALQPGGLEGQIYLPVVNKPDIASRGRRGGAKVTHQAEDLGGQGRELAVLDEVAKMEQ